jgi:hypothetical protein
MTVAFQAREMDRGQVRVDIRIQADLNVSAFVARQKVTGYVVDNISDHMAGDDPTLVVDGDRFLWRVPVQLAVLPRGRLGQVGTIDVDAQSGQLLITNRLTEDVRRNAQALVERAVA